jgi:hypothetical protein
MPPRAVGEFFAGTLFYLVLTVSAAWTAEPVLPGCAALDEELAVRLKGAPLLFFDGALWQDDEMVRAGLGAKTGRRMGHLSMSGAAGSMAALAPLGIERKLFIHINNTAGKWRATGSRSNGELPLATHDNDQGRQAFSRPATFAGGPLSSPRDPCSGARYGGLWEWLGTIGAPRRERLDISAPAHFL